jgi:hypothetical protein
MLTQQRLKELVHYDPDTGVFTWLVDRSDKVKAGDVAGGSNLSHGYRRLCIDYKIYQQHRLAFLYMEGKFPDRLVDHINGIRSDNRWCNLRHADGFGNAQNSAIRSDNTSGHPGIWKPKNKNKWVVQVRNKHVGYCGSFEEAKKMYQQYAIKQYGEFYRPHTPEVCAEYQAMQNDPA